MHMYVLYNSYTLHTSGYIRVCSSAKAYIRVCVQLILFNPPQLVFEILVD